MEDQDVVVLPEGVGVLANVTEAWLRGVGPDNVTIRTPLIEELEFFANNVWPTSELAKVPAVASVITADFDNVVHHLEFVTNKKLNLRLSSTVTREDINPFQKLAESVRAAAERAASARPVISMVYEESVKEPAEDLKRTVHVRTLRGDTAVHENVVTVDLLKHWAVLYVDSEFGGMRTVYNRDEIRDIKVDVDVQMDVD